MSEKPMFSVLVPFWNLQEYCEACVRSILAQNETDFELICVDDGSTDETGSILDALAEKDARMRVIHQENRGVSAARNAALKAARGEYIVFVDGDDRLAEGMLARIREVLDCSGADILCFDYDWFWNGRRQEFRGRNLLYREYSGKEACIRSFREELGGAIVWDKVFSRALLEEEWFWEGKIYEDVDFCYRIFYKAHKVITIPEVLYHHTRRAGSISIPGIYYEWWLNSSEAFIRMVEFLESHGLEAGPSLEMLEIKYRYVRPKVHRSGNSGRSYLRDVDRMFRETMKREGLWSLKKQLIYAVPRLGIPADFHWELLKYRIRKLRILLRLSRQKTLRIRTDAKRGGQEKFTREELILSGRQLPRVLKKEMPVQVIHVWNPTDWDSAVFLFDLLRRLDSFPVRLTVTDFRKPASWIEERYLEDFLKELSGYPRLLYSGIPDFAVQAE